MGQVLIRGIEDSVLQSLKQRAFEHGRSLEAELRRVLTEAARPSRAEIIKDLERIRAMTPKVDGPLSEDLVRESRDER